MADVGASFDQVVGELNYPMYIATTSAAGVNAGCLVGFTTQVSINPPRFLVCLSLKNYTTTVAAAATHLAIHLLRADDAELAQLFGEETGDRTDKFTRCRWSVGPHDVPVLGDAAAWFVGRIEARLEFGDHVGHLLAPEEVELRRPLDSLLSFADVREFDPGHDP
ncbi:MAG TPA: flavin reductase family protein [Mycobacterium sp.]|nr:flavin reductase family protein [Mycobacterium sp.]